MPDWQSMFDSDWLRSCDLPEGKDATLRIASVQAGTLQNSTGKKAKKPVLTFHGKTKDGEPIKPYAANKTNCKIIAAMYGNNTDDWVGQRIILYVTTCEAFGQSNVPCIRVRPKKPPAAAPVPSSKEVAGMFEGGAA